MFPSSHVVYTQCQNVVFLMIIIPGVSELETFLENLSLGKYWPLFESQNVDLKRFLEMSEEDLKSVGLK